MVNIIYALSSINRFTTSKYPSSHSNYKRHQLFMMTTILDKHITHVSSLCSEMLTGVNWSNKLIVKIDTFLPFLHFANFSPFSSHTLLKPKHYRNLQLLTTIHNYPLNIWVSEHLVTDFTLRNISPWFRLY